MIFESPNPLTARERFTTRGLRNKAYIAGIFIVAVTGMSLFSSIVFPGAFLPMLAGDAVALAGAYYYYLVWDKRPILLQCTHCDGIILTNVPWVCGFKGCKNERADEFPFVHKCEHCGAEPKAYRCHHHDCGKVILLTADVRQTDYAIRLDRSNDISSENERTKELRMKQKMKEDKEHDVSMARDDVTLAELKQRHKQIKGQMKVKKKKPAIEAKRENLKEFFGSHVAAEQAAHEQKVANAEDCKNDRKELKRRDRIVDFWLEREKAGENEENV